MLQEHQERLLRKLINEVLSKNPFYQRHWAGAVSPETPLASVPFTRKADLIADQREHPPYGTNLLEPVESFSRFHQTSGTTTGKPLCWLDTSASWDWVLDCWGDVYQLAGVTASDRLIFPFSFGPFLGFWSAFEAASRLGCLCLPAGGMSSSARLRLLIDHRATVVCCTPTYAIHLGEVALQEGIDLRESAVRMLIVAGEPGGAIPSTRERIESSWGAQLIDHYGLTEVGPVGVESIADPGGLTIPRERYIAEVVQPHGDSPTQVGDVGELVLTNLGRWGMPLIRYRTGDLVRRSPPSLAKTGLPPSLAKTGLPRHRRADKPEGRADRPEGENYYLEGGIIGRVDDMIQIRGNNLYPSAIEEVVRQFPEVSEFRVRVDQRSSLAQIEVEVEPRPDFDGKSLAEDVAKALQDTFLFRLKVVAVEPGTLPRFELKAKRFVWTDQS